jgi:hypothetical protein
MNNKSNGKSRLKTCAKIFGLVAIMSGLASAVVFAQTATWVGNTSANSSATTNWTFSSGSGPVANGDSLVFGAAGSAGASLTNDKSSLLVNNFTINPRASAFTFGGNNFTLYGKLSDAASVNETFRLNGITIGSGPALIVNTGTGTLALGPLSRETGGTVKFIITGTITTSTTDQNGMLGGWAVIDNGDNSYSFADSGGSGVNDIRASTSDPSTNLVISGIQFPAANSITDNQGDMDYTTNNVSLTAC